MKTEGKTKTELYNVCIHKERREFRLKSLSAAKIFIQQQTMINESIISSTCPKRLFILHYEAGVVALDKTADRCSILSESSDF